MSKHPSKTTVWNRVRRGLVCLLSLALLAGLIPGTVVTAHAASDSNWAMSYAQTLMDWGVMRGDIAGNLRLGDKITRAEFIAMMNRAYGYTKLGGHPFTDVSNRDWFAEDIDIAYNMGYFKGTSPTTASPNDPLSREQATVLLARNMMLETKPGESLGFSDSRSLSEWARGEVAAAAESGLVTGQEDGSFQPQRDITRGEVAAMLVRAIGNPVNTKGDHTLGNVYGNVTVSTAGVTLRDGVVAGSLYLTGGIDLGDVLLQNVDVLGEIVVSGGGESNSSAASIVMRNVTADNMTVDSISDQFVTIRAEGNTNIPTTTVRTNAYVDDSSLPGFGLSYIELAGDPGTMLQLAGNVKEVLNRTPQSDLQVVQGTAQKITMDEYATDSTVLVDGDARIEELNLDVATNVTGTGDIKNLNVGAAGSTVEQLPDNITIRPGITSDINGSQMNSVQAAEASADPRLLAGYPKVKNIAPNSATLVFSANKPGTIYWAISAVSDGSVDEDDLIEPPVYGGNIIQSGTIKVTASKTEYTANLTGLTQDGSYYVSAILVDGRGNRSPLKVTAFTTPDGTTPAFNSGYPYMSKVSTETAQVTVMPNKSCRMYYALLPAGSTAPTPAEFKANAITGNLGYGVVDVVKNVTQPVNVNSTRLQELTRYTLYLWLTDYDGAKSSQVYSLNFTTPDEQPPVIVTKEQTNADPTAIELTFTLNEGATLFWTIIPEGQDKESSFEGISTDVWNKDTVSDPNDRRLQIRIENGAGSSVVKNGRKVVNAAYTNAQVTLNETRPLDAGTSNYTMYLVAKDAAGNYSKVEKIHVRTQDGSSPTVRQEFSPRNPSSATQPLVDTSVKLIFSESIQGGTGQDKIFLDLYQAVEDAQKSTGTSTQTKEELEAVARTALAKALYDHIRLYYNSIEGDTEEPVTKVNTSCHVNTDNEIVADTSDWVINYCNAVVKSNSDGEVVVTFPGGRENPEAPALRLSSGQAYHFNITAVYDTSEEHNPLNETRDGSADMPPFTTMYATVKIEEVSQRNPDVITKAVDGSTTLFTVNADGSDFTPGAGSPIKGQNDDNKYERIDRSFHILRQFSKDSVAISANMCYDILIWSDTNMTITLYSRPTDDSGTPTDTTWTKECELKFEGIDSTGTNGEKQVFKSLNYAKGGANGAKPGYLHDFESKEYAIHVDELVRSGQPSTRYRDWGGYTPNLQVMMVAGTDTVLERLAMTPADFENSYNTFVPNPLSSIGVPDPFKTDIPFREQDPPKIINVTMNRSDTSPTISIELETPGRAHCIIFPIDSDSLYYDIDEVKGEDGTVIVPAQTKVRVPTGTRVSSIIDQIKEDYYRPTVGVTTAASATPPDTTNPALADVPEIGNLSAAERQGIILSAPLQQTVLTGTFPTDAKVIKRTTAYTTGRVGVPIPNLTGMLEPNTIYFLCVVTQGSLPDSYSQEVHGYIFTTNATERPVLTLRTETDINVRATVDRTSTVSSRLLRLDMLGSEIFYQPFETSENIEPGLTFPSKYKTTTEGQSTRTTTVLDALYREDTDVWGLNNTHPSIFDTYASETLKSTVYLWIESGGGSFGTTAGTFAPKVVNVPTGSTTGGTELMPFPRSTQDNDGRPTFGLDYVCIAMAQSTSTSGATGANAQASAYRAVYPLRLTTNDPPKIINATGLVYNAKTGKTSGSITVLFNTYLYVIQTSTTRVPLTQSASNQKDADGKDLLGLGGRIVSPPYALSIPEPQGQDPDGPYSRTTTMTFNLTAPIAGHPEFDLVFLPMASEWSPSAMGFTLNCKFDEEAGRYVFTPNPRSMLLNP